MTRTYRIYGTTVESDLDLPGAREGNGPADVVISGIGEAPISESVPQGVLLSEVRDGDRLLAATARGTDGSVVLRVCGTAEFTLDGARVTYVRDPMAGVGLLQVLITGMCLATWLQLQGRSILHASGVYVPTLEGVLAFVGQSGMGKSTMATVMARAGCRLVTDDILRVERDAELFVTYHGAVATRLRPKASDLAADFDQVSDTGDNRLLVPLPVVENEIAPLSAIVVPGPDVNSESVQLARLTGAQAMLTLMAFPRLLNWHDPWHPSAALDFHADLVARVPVFASRLPWGPPFRSDLAEHLVTAIRRELA